MGVKFEINNDQKILLKRYLNKNGEAQIRFSKLCAKEMNNYVPFLSGRLKDWSVQVNKNNVTYNALYARRQYYENTGRGVKNTSGLRGKLWDRRMWVDKGDGIVKSISEFVGGRAK